jgi:hypothetical protein
VNTTYHNNDSLATGEENLAESILRDAIGDRERETILRIEGHLDGLYTRQKSLAEELEALMGEERWEETPKVPASKVPAPVPVAPKAPVAPVKKNKPWFMFWHAWE